MRHFKVDGQVLVSRIKNVLELVRSAKVAFHVVLPQMVHEHFLVEKMFLAKLAVRVQGNKVPVLVELAGLEMAVQLLSPVDGLFIDQKRAMVHTKIAEISLMRFLQVALERHNIAHWLPAFLDDALRAFEFVAFAKTFVVGCENAVLELYEVVLRDRVVLGVRVADDGDRAEILVAVDAAGVLVDRAALEAALEADEGVLADSHRH